MYKIRERERGGWGGKEELKERDKFGVEGGEADIQRQTGREGRTEKDMDGVDG